jgi:O6-methylguanine-DNA--protein-cysteine methyltransferase
MHREISDLEQRLQSLRHAAGTAISAVLSKAGIGTAARPTRRRGRPAGSGKKAAAAAATPAAATGAVKRGPGRPPGSGKKKRGPGRPKGSSNAAAAPAAGASASSTAAPAKRGRRRRSAITPEQLASRQLQGRYLGLIRQVPASKRAQYQKIAKEKGREAAIRELQDAVKK